MQENFNPPGYGQDADTAPRLIVDLNSLLNAALLGGKDPDADIQVIEGKPVPVNTARYGVDRLFDRLAGILNEMSTAPRNVIGVWDGANAKSVRQRLLPGYKAPSKADPVYEQLNLARPIVSQMLRDMGAHTVQCETCEADDVIGYLAQRLRTRRNIVVSGDGDLAVLVDENTSVLKLDNSGRGKGDQIDINPFGPFPHKFITVYKALVGDTSDKIPGAKGFGDAAFVKLVRTFGLDGLEMMEALMRTNKLATLAEDVGEMKELQRIIDSSEQVVLSWRCAKLMPERVNTLQHPLQWTAGFARLWDELAEDARVEALKKHYATCSLVHAGNYERMKQALAQPLASSPFVALDIETSVPEEALEWQAMTRSRGAKGVHVDVLGSTLTGKSLTFGENAQHTVYMTVDHREEEGVRNITSEQARQAVELVPVGTHLVIHNRGFELPVLRGEWGDVMRDNGWYGFLPNTLDTKVEASYVDENLPLGLKLRSFTHLDYKQGSYEETTTLSGPAGTLPPGGMNRRLFKHCTQPARTEWTTNSGGEVEEVEVEPAVYEDWESRQYQMNELTASHVFSYGCDDTRVTAALHTWFRIIMEMEGTWQTYLDLEQLPEYLTSLGFMQGAPIDLGKLAEMEAEDRASLGEAQQVLDAYLIEKGWEGTTLPRIEMTPELIKRAVNIILGPVAGEDGEPAEFTTRKRKPEAIAADVLDAYPASAELAELVANILRQGEARKADLQQLVEDRFTGRPDFNPGSPKQVQKLLYSTIGMQPRVFNKLTDKQRQDEKFRAAFYAKRDYDEGTLGREPTEYERTVWASKSSTDDDAVEYGLHQDSLPEREQGVLKAFLKIKEINTRISLFYNAYAVLPHWKDGRIHSSFNQCQAVTRRWSSAEPNLQQLPSRGEGVKFRDLLIAPRDYLYVSLDWSGQELRLMADYSKDETMLSCYIGDSLKDIHSLVAVRCAPFIWGSKVGYEDFQVMRKSESHEVADKAKSLRDGAKTTNFATQYGAQALKVALQLKTEEATAQKFIDAKDNTFPGINRWKAEVEEEVSETGLAYTKLGVPRHLRASVLSPNSWIRSKAARQGPNFKIQGSGAEMAKQALSRMWSSGVFTGKLRASFVGPIHDEVVFLVHRDDALEAIRVCHKIMTEQYADMTVPLESSLAIGLTFKAEVELGTTFSDEQVREAVHGLFAPKQAQEAREAEALAA